MSISSELRRTKIRIAGVDEVGRGPLAGPVIAAAVILDVKKPIKGLADSKLLSPKQRERLAELIKENSIAWAIGRAEVAEIDALNIHHASLLAMSRAVEQLHVNPEEVWVDGRFCPKTPYPTKAIVQGDRLISAISAASIIAKVIRDAEMVELDMQYPGYGFALNKGYPTPSHKARLQKNGVSPIHRLSFRPVRELVENLTL